MKKCILLFVVVLCSNLFSAVVDSSATMDSLLVENLRKAVDNDGQNDDEIMDFYYEIVNSYDGRNDGDDGDWREDRVDYKPIDGAYYFAQKAFIGMLSVEIDTLLYPDIRDTTLLNWGRDYLLDPLFDLYPNNPDNPYEYLDLNLVWNEFTSGWQNNHDFLLADLLTHCAFILDILWYYLDDTPGGERDQMYAIVDNMANFVNIVIEQPNITGRFYDLEQLGDPDWDTRYPSSFSTDTNNIRIFFSAALGYTCSVCIYFLT